ncbi:hypothetical protein EON09_07340 [Pseudomonas soli]|jgi:hypothetical protein|uniref:Uncharacterized protein n=1 Tax=Pseudomonas soli TaxID=1306993 RepID=A0A1H9AFJ2_9PSED|nr:MULTISPECIES: hypothetical protein [Pseudomonas]AUY33541.1 hypothetical protein C3F42_10085 [Pseudomonas sp. PONIH3]MDT3714069.1 hypothetical protein [Pseudomonas soli]MDT3730787.1 hypothetical protein [Pseudomonas soli]MEE1880643.1 hypothetical protein [Pseudomonas soli]NBK38341.1 hypothetical protein [Pseudomonas soli]
MKKFKPTLVALTLLCSVMAPAAWAVTAQSWNLARDMYIATQNAAPDSPWSFMQNKTAVNAAANYTPMPTFVADSCSGANVTCWRDDATGAYVSVIKKSFTFTGSGGSFVFKQGEVATHPGAESQSIVRWASPIAGKINVLGRVNDLHNACGDGITWSLNLGDSVLQSGNLANGGSAVIKASDVEVSTTSMLYLVIDRKVSNACDATSLDLLVTN